MAARRGTLGGESFASVLAAAQTGAGWACRELWNRYSGPVCGYLTARGSNEPDDLTSEVFLAVFDRLAGFSGGEPEFRSFVFTIAHHRLTDELRARARRGPTLEWSAETDPRISASAELEAIDRIADEGARALLEALPPDQRNVLVLRIVGDLTIEQIAQLLDKRVGAVKALQRRGLESLRRRIASTRTLSAASVDDEG